MSEHETERVPTPRLARLLFRLLVRGEANEFVLGDIEEEFHTSVTAHRGRRAARRWYWRNVLRSIRSVRRKPRRSAPAGEPSSSPLMIMENTLHSIRFAVRTWVKQPAVTMIALAAIALGIGANSAIFSVVYGVLLNPLGYPEPAQLQTVWIDNALQGWPKDVTSFPNFTDWREWNETFVDMAALRPGSDNVTGIGDPSRLPATAVSPTFFDVLGVSPQLGRGFATSDWDSEERLVVLSHGMWQQQFGGTDDVLGKSFEVNGTPHVVIGVMPPGFHYVREDIRYWRLFVSDVRESSRGSLWLQVVGRLDPGVGLGRARADMDRVGLRLQEEYPDFYSGYGVSVVPLLDEVVGDVRPALFVLLGSVGLVLLIACANVANLMLARASDRQREIVVRSALGATPGRLFQQVLVESVLLSLVGGALGLGLAVAGLGFLRSLEPDLPRLADVGLHTPVLMFTLAMSALTGVVFGLLPAAHAASPDLADCLKERAATSATRGGRRFRTGLVVAEIALALVLLVGAGLLLRSYSALQQIQPGFDPDRLLTFRVSLSGPNYEDGDDARSFFSQLLERLRSTPGVESVAGVFSLPMSGSYASGFFTIEGRPPVERSKLQEIKMNVVTPRYFETMAVPLVAGRSFSEIDTSDGESVIIVNEAFAAAWFSGEDPVGQRFLYGTPRGYDEEQPLPWNRIVGVVGNERQRALEVDPEPEIYAPYDQAALGTLFLVVRTVGDPAALAPTARRAVWALDPGLPVAGIETMSGRIGRTTAARRLNTTLLLLFAGVAATLAAIGIYGVISYWVNQQTRDIGIRMALGAHRRDVMRMIMRHTVGVVIAGVAIGLVAALFLTRLMASLLFGVASSDPATFFGVALLLGSIAMIASFVPARRATRIDPVQALKD